MNNESLLEILIPSDNLDQENMNIGAYHFRFWKLGHWYDVTIDDFLPINKSGELIFSYNNSYPNEFWLPLLEKALAKFMGSYDELEGCNFENTALILSGGVHETYSISDVIDESNEESDSIPSPKELFEIIRLGNERKYMIGCILEDVGAFSISQTFSIFIQNDFNLNFMVSRMILQLDMACLLNICI